MENRGRPEATMQLSTAISEWLVIDKYGTDARRVPKHPIARTESASVNNQEGANPSQCTQSFPQQLLSVN